jgi:type II secretory ATPase GspE/PulE/Tfp pilus assembly ATPase PilB-like protein
VKQDWPKSKLLELGIDPELLKAAPDNVELYVPKGCPKCRETGYGGRIGCFEVLNITHTLKDYILQRRSANEIKEHALRTGNLVTLRKDSSKKLLDGITSLDEVLRNTNKDD